MTTRISSLVFALLISAMGWADCTTIPTFSSLPTGKQGQLSISAAPYKLMFCDGTNWRDFGGTPTVTACTKNGEMQMTGGEMRYCNSLVWWPFDSGLTTNGSCTKTGEIKYNTGTSKMEFCNGTDWRVVDDDGEPVSFTWNTTTNTSWEANIVASIRQLTGITGGLVTLNSTGTTCTGYGYRVCADVACASIISSGNFNDGDTVSVANDNYVRVNFLSARAASETCTASMTMGSMTATLTSTTAATDTTVSPFNWGPTRSAAASSLITSAVVRLAGHSGVTGTISDMGTGGNPEFRVCSDNLCNTELVTWGSASQTVPTNGYVQLRTTTGAAQSGRRVSFSAGSTPTVGLWYATTGSCGNPISVAAGANYTCTCGTNIVSQNLTVIGTGAYRQSGDPCSAAIHAGLISDATGGSITVKGVGAGSCASFTGSTLNGVTSTSQGTSGTAYYFPAAGADPCP